MAEGSEANDLREHISALRERLNYIETFVVRKLANLQANQAAVGFSLDSITISSGRDGVALNEARAAVRDITRQACDRIEHAEPPEAITIADECSARIAAIRSDLEAAAR